MSRVKLDSKGRATALKVYWSKRERALIYDGEKQTGGMTADVFERMPIVYGDTTFVKELERSGYDLTTLRLSVQRKPIVDS
ncbi:MAG TPA: hypothetical protein VGM94_00680 [Galbitalea sp.]|jgi:hypothetical protein